MDMIPVKSKGLTLRRLPFAQNFFLCNHHLDIFSNFICDFSFVYNVQRDNSECDKSLEPCLNCNPHFPLPLCFLGQVLGTQSRPKTFLLFTLMRSVEVSDWGMFLITHKLDWQNHGEFARCISRSKSVSHSAFLPTTVFQYEIIFPVSAICCDLGL